jgi:predicted PurR-regulated permease PerM
MAKAFDTVNIARWFFIFSFVGVSILFWKVIEPFAMVLMTAAIVAIIVTPVEQHVRRWVGHPKVSATIMLALVLSAVVLPLVTIALLTANQAVELVQNTLADPEWLQSFDVRSLPFIQALPQVLITQILSIDVTEVLRNIATWIVRNIGTIFASSADIIFKTFIFFVSLYFFLVDREKIHAELLLLSPLKDSIDENILMRLVATVRGVVFGSLIIAVIQGVIAAIGLTVFGVPAPLIWAGLVVIAAQVPMLGTSVIMLPAVIYLALSGSAPQAIGLLVWSLLAVGLVDNLLQPIVVGGRTHMHALLILLSMLGGLNAFGPIGFIFGPTILAAFLVMIELYRAGVLEKKRV